MADNITIAADDQSSVYHQRVINEVQIAAVPTDQGGRDMGGTAGAAAFTDNRLSVVRKTATPTIDTSAYASGDAVGGLLTFTTVNRASALPITIASVTVSDLAKQSAALTLVLFIVTFTATADQAAFDPSDADILNLAGTIEIAAGDYSAFNDSSAATWPQTTAHPGLLVLPSGTSLFGQLVTYGTPTYVGTADLTVALNIIQH